MKYIDLKCEKCGTVNKVERQKHGHWACIACSNLEYIHYTTMYDRVGLFADAPKHGRGDNLTHCLATMYSRITKLPFIIVETGTINREDDGRWYGDGWSTRLFGWFAKKYNGILYTIDNNKDHIVISKRITKEYIDNIEFMYGDSVNMLKKIDMPIDLMYFDSAMDSTLTLEECKIIYPMFHKNTVVLFDDTYGCHGTGGKGWEAIEFMLQLDNWKVESLQINQVMLIQNGDKNE